MEFDFAGKWAFIIMSGVDVVGYVGLADASSDTLSIISDTSINSLDPRTIPANGLFNAYADTNDVLILQASNGKYIVSAGEGYAASAERSATPAHFSLEDAGGGASRIVQVVGQQSYYWNKQNGNLGRIAKASSPPKTVSPYRLLVSRI